MLLIIHSRSYRFKPYYFSLFTFILLHPPPQFSIEIGLVVAVVTAKKLIQNLRLALTHLQHVSPVGHILRFHLTLQRSKNRLQRTVVVLGVGSPPPGAIDHMPAHGTLELLEEGAARRGVAYVVFSRNQIKEQPLIGDGILPVQFVCPIRIVLGLVFSQIGQILGQGTRMWKILYKNCRFLIRLPVLKAELALILFKIF